MPWSLLYLPVPAILVTLRAMLAKVYSCAVIGLDGAVVEVKVDTSNGFPSFVDAGLPDAMGPGKRA